MDSYQRYEQESQEGGGNQFLDAAGRAALGIGAAAGAVALGRRGRFGRRNLRGECWQYGQRYRYARQADLCQPAWAVRNDANRRWHDGQWRYSSIEQLSR